MDVVDGECQIDPTLTANSPKRKEYLSSFTRHLRSSKSGSKCKAYLTLLVLFQIALQDKSKSFLSKGSSIYFREHLPVANG